MEVDRTKDPKECTVDEPTILEREEKAINKLKTMKRDSGSLQLWFPHFD
jgi:hypothetical protein